MIAKHFAAFLIIVVYVPQRVWTETDESFFDTDEQHDFQVPLFLNPNHVRNTKTKVRQNLIQKVLTAVKGQKQFVTENARINLISGPELLEIRDLLLDDKYKPWGAASLPTNNHNNQVILDKIDDELFTPNSERHSYDERNHEEIRAKLVG